MKGIGKPCTGKLFARFDEGGLALPALYSTLMSTSIKMRIEQWKMASEKNNTKDHDPEQKTMPPTSR